MVHKNPEKYIIWIDVETTGTITDVDKLLEIGVVITDLYGNVITNTWHSLFKVDNLPQLIQKNVSEKVYTMHTKSGLWLDLWKFGGKKYSVADQELSNWLSQNIEKDTILYFGGNSITLDRNFVKHFLPTTYQKISYRSIDVTSISIFAQHNSNIPGYTKKKEHRALSDALDSAQEYKHYVKWLNKIDNFSINF